MDSEDLPEEEDESEEEEEDDDEDYGQENATDVSVIIEDS